MSTGFKFKPFVCYPVDYVIDLLRQTLDSGSGLLLLPSGNSAPINKTLRTFLRCGTTCDECQMVAHHFIERRRKETKEPRFSLHLRSIDGVQFAADHIIPRSRGGSGIDANLRTLCVPCNSKKRDTFDGECITVYRIASYKDLLYLKYGENDPRFQTFFEEYALLSRLTPDFNHWDRLSRQVVAHKMNFENTTVWGYLTIDELRDYAADIEKRFGISADISDMDVQRLPPGVQRRLREFEPKGEMA